MFCIDYTILIGVVLFMYAIVILYFNKLITEFKLYYSNILDIIIRQHQELKELKEKEKYELEDIKYKQE